MFSRGSVLKIVLGGVLLLGASSVATEPVQAYSCRARIEQKERDLHRAIWRHGAYSRQAEHERNELWKAQRSCGYGWRR
jgi:hypothetical protein